MGSRERISRAFESPLRLPLTENSKYLLLSDCHRGIGDTNDNFLKMSFYIWQLWNIILKEGSHISNWGMEMNSGRTVL